MALRSCAGVPETQAHPRITAQREGGLRGRDVVLLSGPRSCARTDVYRESLSICRTNDRMSEQGDPGAQGQAAEKPRASVPSGEQGQCRVCWPPRP